jgi:HEPN domain-containing protein
MSHWEGFYTTPMKRMKTFTRRDGFTQLDLLHFAADHLGCAKVLSGRSSRCFDSAGYLCHLGMELVLKAILLNISNEFPNEHSLSELSKLIEKQGLKINYGKQHSHTVRMLDGFNELRYPNPSNPIEIGNDVLERIENLFDFLYVRLPKRIQEKLKQLDHSHKGNRVLMSKKKAI